MKDSTRNDPNITYNMLSIFACFYVGEASQSHTSLPVESFSRLDLMLDMPNTDRSAGGMNERQR